MKGLRIVFLVYLMVMSAVVQAQRFPSQVWHTGKLVLLEGDTLQGDIMYNQETDLIQYSINGGKTIQTFTARKLIFFEIFDEARSAYRQFYALPYSLRGGYKAPIIFELIREGRKITLLSREAIENKVVNSPYSATGIYTRTELVYTYYFLKPDGTIDRFRGKKKDLIWIMRKKSDEIKKFIKSENIKVDRRSDLVRVAAYYNSLFDNA